MVEIRILARGTVAWLALTGAGSVAAANHEVQAANGLGFVPSSLTIQVGDTVTWRNVSGEHNVVADDRSFRNAVGVGWTFTRTFDRPGVVPYYCEPHGGPGGFGMSGEIKVVSATSAFQINEGVQGSWLNNATGGQGVFFDVVPSLDNLFAMAWFTWTQTPGQHDWLTAVGRYAGDRVQMDLFRSRGGRFNAPDPVATTPAGSASIVFTSCTTATLSFTLTDPPATGTIPLQRLLPASAICVSANPTLAAPD